MSKSQALRTNGARGLNTAKALAISSAKGVGLVSIVAVLAFWAGLFTVQGLIDMVNTGINLPITAYAAYGLVALVIVTYTRTREFICKAVKEGVGSKKWWYLAHGVFIVASLAMAGWILGGNLGAWAIGAALLWASIRIKQAWSSSESRTGLGIEELNDLLSDESTVMQGPWHEAATA